MADVDAPDDLTIGNEAVLWRRVPPWHFVWDENRKQMRPSTAAFENDDDGSPMSVALAAACKSSDEVMVGHQGFALVAFTAGLPGNKANGSFETRCLDNLGTRWL